MTLGKTNTFKEHCMAKAATANQRIALLKMISGKSWGANKATLLRLYKQFIRPVLEYGAVAFTTKDAASIMHLQLAERRALRVVLRVGKLTHIKDLYDRTGLQPIDERI
jgi:hypothetical protein